MLAFSLLLAGYLAPAANTKWSAIAGCAIAACAICAAAANCGFVQKLQAQDSCISCKMVIRAAIASKEFEHHVLAAGCNS
jgi:hypothetical protein